MEGLKKRGIIVKINSIILPGINDDHIPAVAEKMKDLGVDLFNCMPYYPNEGSEFEYLAEPDTETINRIRKESEKYVKQMRHCTRCRSDACGLLGEAPSHELMNTLKNCQHLEVLEPKWQHVSKRPYVAVASIEGVLVNQHLGEASQIMIYGEKEGRLDLMEMRQAPSRAVAMDKMEGTGPDSGRLPRFPGQWRGHQPQKSSEQQWYRYHRVRRSDRGSGATRLFR